MAQAQKTQSKKITAKISKESHAMHMIFEDLFNDMYEQRQRVYRMNFVRGIFYGLGTALGGTVLLALVLWMLSWFVDWPYVGRIIEQLTISPTP